MRPANLLCLLLAALSIAACASSAPDTATKLRSPTPIGPLASTAASLAPSALGLTGRLVFLAYTSAQRSTPSLVQLDLASGRQTTLFEPPNDTTLSAAAVSPDGKQVVLAYAPPASNGEAVPGYTDLYRMPVHDPQQLRPLLKRTAGPELYFNPVWSPDGRFVYYAHGCASASAGGPCVPSDTGQYRYAIGRIGYPDGQPEQLIQDAIWPRLSRSGAKLAYVAFRPDAGTNDLLLANADGSHPITLTQPGSFTAVDAPLFSSDDQLIIFSAVSRSGRSSLSPLDRLFGVQIASAHSLPSDWWRLPAAGGQPEQITRIADIGLYGALSPDGRNLAFVTASGLYVMRLDGSHLTRLSGVSVTGTLDWIP